MGFDPVSSLLELGGSLISRIWPDPAMQAEQLYRLNKLAQDGDLARLDATVKEMTGQLDINKIEAAHKSIFVAGWRPFVGWIGGFSLAYAGILEPLMRFGATMAGYEGEFPIVDTTQTITILMGMLGIGVMRSVDKKNGTQTDAIEEKK